MLCCKLFFPVSCFDGVEFNGLHVPYGTPRVHNQSDVIGRPAFRCVQWFEAYCSIACSRPTLLIPFAFVKQTRDIFRTF